jgi:hypothetical protein
MKPLRHPLFSIDGRGHGRTPAVQLLLDERNALIRSAARFYPGCTDREIARRLHQALSRYAVRAWRREAPCEVCPPRHKGKLTEVLWMIRKTKDAPVAERTLRRALAAPTRGPRFEV